MARASGVGCLDHLLLLRPSPPSKDAGGASRFHPSGGRSTTAPLLREGNGDTAGEHLLLQHGSLLSLAAYQAFFGYETGNRWSRSESPENGTKNKVVYDRLGLAWEHIR
jgi:hypothetical protein